MRSAAANASARPSCSAVAPLRHRAQERVDHRVGVVGEELPPEFGDVLIGQLAAQRFAFTPRSRQTLVGAQHERGEVVRVAPLAALLRTRSRGRLAHERRQHGAGGVGADVAERLERLVREVDGVAAVDEDVVGHRREHHPFDVLGVARRDRGGERTLGGVRRPGLDEAAVPLAETLGIDAVVERVEPEPRRLIARVARHEDEPVREREAAVGLVEVRQEVGHRDEHGEPRAPAVPPVARAEVEPDLHDVGRLHPGLEQPEHGLRDHEREPVFETLLQPAAQVRHGIAGVARVDEHVVTVDRHVEATRVVGERIEGAAARKVEAGVVPVTRDEAALDRALVQREAHVRAAVLDRVRAVFVPEHHHRQRPDLGEQLPGLAQLLERSRVHTHAASTPTGDDGCE